jgi:hypothetical protein
MNLKVGVETIRLAREQRLEFAARDFLFERLQGGFGFLDDGLIVLGLAEFDHPDLVLEFALDLPDTGQRILQRGPLLHQLLRLLGIVPEIGILGELVQFSKARG